MTRFSVIVPTLNRQGPLADCLAALARMDYPQDRFEVVVVDDGSEVTPAALVASFRDRLNVRVLTQDRAGPAVARNRGAAEAQYEYLAFTDDDCAPTTHWLSAMARRISNEPEKAVSGRKINALAGNIYSAASQAISDTATSHFNADHGAARFLTTSSAAMPTHSFHAIGGFDADTFSIAAAEDRDLCARWRGHGLDVVYEPDAVVYHAHPLSLSSLWRQHFNFGRGACRYHAACAQRGDGRLKPDPRFYRKLLVEPWRRERGRRKLLLPLCILLAEWANLCGYLSERRAGFPGPTTLPAPNRPGIENA